MKCLNRHPVTSAIIELKSRAQERLMELEARIREEDARHLIEYEVDDNDECEMDLTGSHNSMETKESAEVSNFDVELEIHDPPRKIRGIRKKADKPKADQGINGGINPSIYNGNDEIETLDDKMEEEVFQRQRHRNKRKPSLEDTSISKKQLTKSPVKLSNTFETH
ncbi:hypothetical protein AVEN_181066-1 [Araneus ventricosus]|uniref:Uncharacterized protein n=1 Tax=Araneus ventricosus TaxID=182803 RepID=A0A4Y2RUJ5_ARAVE|nr:hypothetical protein AVEN_181066-1 [Araneus ventricosus]